MKTTHLFKSVFFIVLFGFSSFSATAQDSTFYGVTQGVWQEDTLEYLDHTIALKFRDSINDSTLTRVVNSVNGSVGTRIDSLNWVIVHLPDSLDVMTAQAFLQQDGSLEIAVPRFLSRPFFTDWPNDPDSSIQWYLKNKGLFGGTYGADIHIYDAWNITMGNSNVILVILDSGYPLPPSSGGPTHQELSNLSRITTGKDCIYPYFFKGDVYPHYVGNGYIGYESDNRCRDEDGHGSLVLGLATAEANNSLGIAGVAPQCKAIVNQVFGRLKKGEDTTIMKGCNEAFRDGIDWAVQYQRDHESTRVVVNYSGGGPEEDPIMQAAVANASSNGIPLIIAAGNIEAGQSSDSVQYPAMYWPHYSNVIAVGATDNKDHLWNSAGGSSCWRGGVTISAPGGGIDLDTTTQIWSTVPQNTYTHKEGTSLAAPLVTGTVGLMLSVNRELSASQIRSRLQISADWKSDSRMGAGRLNAYKAVLAAMAPLPISPSHDSVASLPPILIWDQPKSGATYRVQISRNSDMSSPVRDTSGLTTTTWAASGLQYATYYFWKVGTVDTGSVVHWSEVMRFRTGPAPVPQLSSPSQCATVATPPTLSWQSVSGSTSYTMQVSTNSSFTAIVKDTSGITNTSCTLNGLTTSGRYYWRVSAFMVDSVPQFSGYRYFQLPAPAAASLSGTTVARMYNGEKELNPKLTWSVSDWCNVNYSLYRYWCSNEEPDCTPVDCDLNGTMIYNGNGQEFIDYNTSVGPNMCRTTYYYIKATATVGGPTSQSNKIYFGEDEVLDPEKRGIAGDVQDVPTQTMLYENYPNPFNPTTEIRYALNEDCQVDLVIYDVLGQEMSRLIDQKRKSAGYYSISFDGSGLPSGLYFYRLLAGTFTDIKKMMLVK